MTPKENAERLIKNFGKVDIFIHQDYKDIDCRIEDTDWKGTAEICAIIAIDEIIIALNFNQLQNLKMIEYWIEVRQEIERL